jgi:hypothetical protein
MQPIDQLVFGDNQFFGINHMSQDKAQELGTRFQDIEQIFAVYRFAFDAGVRAVMLNSNDRAREICDRFRARAAEYPQLSWYPSIPYPHKYANIIGEMGILPALNSILFKDASALRGLGMLTQGGMALISRDAVQLMRMLVDLELRAFGGLEVRVVFLQNVITDLILGLGLADFFAEYCEHIRKRYGALPGFITQNLPLLRQKLAEWGISGAVICASINKIGYLMSPDLQSYEQALAENDSSRIQVMAMSTLASGAVPVREACAYINELNLQSVVFGASSQKHIEETVRLIDLAGARRSQAPR